MSKSSVTRTHRAEIHSHSTASDGVLSPSRLAKICHERGIEIWSLTDHDNCYGCAEAKQAADELGIEFIPGIEVSAYEEGSVHVLGYGVDFEGETIESYAARRTEARGERMSAMIERLAKLGVQIDLEAVERVADGGILGRPHLARALVEAGRVSNIQQAFDRWLHTGGPAHVAVQWPSVPDAIDIIHRAGGLAVLAHPGQYGRDERIGAWVEAGLDGIEIIHPKHGKAAERRYEEIAESHGVLKTASSDFHGTGKRMRHFGSVPFPTSWLDALLEALRSGDATAS